MFICVICQHKTSRKTVVCSRCRAVDACAPKIRKKLPRLSNVEARDTQRHAIAPDRNAALGGGAAYGSVILVAGSGGVGKTTEMLRVSSKLGTIDRPSTFALSERDPDELAAHAKLTNVDVSTIEYVVIKSLDDLWDYLEPGMHLVLDSWGNLEHKDPSDLERLREAIYPGTAWLVCHVNKSGDLEGREKLKHTASAIVWVRARYLYTAKNWHGPSKLRTPRANPFLRENLVPARRKIAKLATLDN